MHQVVTHPPKLFDQLITHLVEDLCGLWTVAKGQGHSETEGRDRVEDDRLKELAVATNCTRRPAFDFPSICSDWCRTDIRKGDTPRPENELGHLEAPLW